MIKISFVNICGFLFTFWSSAQKQKMEIISVYEVNVISYLWDQHHHELLKYFLFTRSTCQSNLITKAICSRLWMSDAETSSIP